jgi:hypothetical protein
MNSESKQKKKYTSIWLLVCWWWWLKMHRSHNSFAYCEKRGTNCWGIYKDVLFLYDQIMNCLTKSIALYDSIRTISSFFCFHLVYFRNQRMICIREKSTFFCVSFSLVTYLYIHNSHSNDNIVSRSVINDIN